MIVLKIFLWIVAVLLILLFPLAAFGNSMSSVGDPSVNKGSYLIQFGLPLVGVVLVVLLVTGRIG